MIQLKKFFSKVKSGTSIRRDPEPAIGHPPGWAVKIRREAESSAALALRIFDDPEEIEITLRETADNNRPRTLRRRLP